MCVFLVQTDIFLINIVKVQTKKKNIVKVVNMITVTKRMLHGQQYPLSAINMIFFFDNGNQYDKCNQEHANIIYSRQEIYLLHPVARHDSHLQCPPWSNRDSSLTTTDL